MRLRMQLTPPTSARKRARSLRSYTCTRCGVKYNAKLVGMACPVCRVPVGGGPALPWALGNDYSLRLLLAAAVGNLLIFAAVAWALLR